MAWIAMVPWNMRRFAAVTGYSFMLVGLLAALAACHRAPPEQAIRDTIARMQEAGEKQDIDGVMKPVAEDFSGRGDDEINLDRKQLQQLLVMLRMRNGGEAHAKLGPVTVAVGDSERATADFTMLVTGGSGLIPKDGQVEQVHPGWRRYHGDWLLISADWKAGVAGQ